MKDEREDGVCEDELECQYRVISPRGVNKYAHRVDSSCQEQWVARRSDIQ